MVLFPNCKINLGLNVVGKRSDGFHDIESVFFPIGLHDAVEGIRSRSSATIQFSTSGKEIAGNPQTNLCVKAYELLRKDFSKVAAIKMHLHKTIPIGAGLGGGSADGAFTLELLNQIFNLGLSKEKLIEYAFQLGSDCPFFVINKPCFASGRGEILETIELDLSAYRLILVNPQIQIDTAEAFSLVNPLRSSKSIKETIGRPVETWRNELGNDFEEPVFKKYPEIKKIKDHLYNAGALYASMSGSGSSVYGIFEKQIDIQLSLSPTYFMKTIPL